MKIALYARCSTKHQDTTGQLEELRQYARNRGLEIVSEYVDNGVSGAKSSRPELNRLLSDAKRRRFDLIAIWKLDRLGRSLSHLVTLIADLNALEIGLVSLRDSLDLSTPSGRLMVNMLSCFAEFERDLIRERVQAGVDRAKLLGKKFGSANPKHARQPKIDRSELAGLSHLGTSEAARHFGVSRQAILKARAFTDSILSTSPIG